MSNKQLDLVIQINKNLMKIHDELNDRKCDCKKKVICYKCEMQQEILRINYTYFLF